MGRGRKPLEMQKGHLTQEIQAKKEAEEQAITVGNDQLRRAPPWLKDPTAKKEYRRITKELEKIEVVGNLDLNNLAGYCNAYAMYRKATDELQDQPLIVEQETKYGVQQLANPLIQVQSKYAEEMRKFARLCGLTIDSRLKAATVKVDREDDAISEAFGGI